MKYQSQEVEILSKRTIFGKTVAEVRILATGQIADVPFTDLEVGSHTMVDNWSKQRDQGLLLDDTKTTTSEISRDVIMAENKQLRRKLDQTEKRLQKTELLVELQIKLSAFMEMDFQSGVERSAACIK